MKFFNSDGGTVLLKSKAAKRVALGMAIAAVAFGSALAGGYFQGLPALTTLTGLETIPFDTNKSGGASPQTAEITSLGLAGYVGSQPNSSNGLIGGDFALNLWQRGTTSASITTALLYGPDRWWGLSGTGTAFTIIKETGSTDITTRHAATARVQRTASQTGILPICVGQVLTSANSTKFQGRVVEFQFVAKSGANFSPAPDSVNVTIATGTGSDESAANFSTGAWTGYAATVTSNVAISTTFAKYSVVGTVPAAATQIGVKICYTPVGTAGADDWFEFTGAQLDVNPSAVANTVFGAFDYEPSSIQTFRQYAYFYRLAEPASGAAIPGSCQAVGASTNICNVFLPTTQRLATPVITITTAGTFKVNIAGTPTTIATPTASTCASNACAVTAANTNTAGQAELLTGGGGTGAWDISSEL